jgi:hypothetical protein
MVKCANCGCLSARNRITRELEEVEKTTRENGETPRTITGAEDSRGLQVWISRQEDLLVCFLQKYDLISEVEKLKKGNTKVTASIMEVIQGERDCSQFVEWKQGFTPKEHQEILDRKQMLDWQAKREDADRRWQSRQNWKLVVVAGVFTILGTILGAMIK